METSGTGSNLPDEMITYTCQFLPYEGLCRLSQTCKKWYHFTWSLKEVSDVKICRLITKLFDKNVANFAVAFFSKPLPCLTSIDLKETKLTEEAARHLFNLAKTTTGLKYLRFKGVDLDATYCSDFQSIPDGSIQHDFHTIPRILASNQRLEALQAPGIYQPPFDFLEKALSGSRIRHLDLSGTWFLPLSFAQALSRMAKLQTVILDGCRFEAQIIAECHRFFMSGQIRFLSLKHSRFKGSSNILPLAAPFELKIKSLNTDMMECPIPGYQNAFIKALEQPECLLESLTASVAVFQKFERIAQFFQAMKKNRSIRRLEITDVIMGRRIVACISNFLKEDRVCDELVLTHVFLRAPAQLTEALCQATHLSRLTIKTDQISARDLVQILKNNISLKYLSISSSSLLSEDARPGAVGISQILQALSENTTMETLVIKQVLQTYFGTAAVKDFSPVIKAYGLQDRIHIT